MFIKLLIDEGSGCTAIIHARILIKLHEYTQRYK